MDRRILKTKKAVRAAFSALLKEKNISQITVSELAEKADIDRRTFYLHYSAVSDIVREIESEAIEELEKAVPKENDFDISSFFEALNTILMSNFDYYKCITSESVYYSFQKECAKILKNTITRTFYEKSGLKKEIFDLYAEYVTGGIMAIYIAYLNGPRQTGIEEFTEIAKSALEESWLKISGKEKIF